MQNVRDLQTDTPTHKNTSNKKKQANFDLFLIEYDGTVVNGTVVVTTDGSDGLYTGTYQISNSTTYTLHIKYNNLHINGSPWTVTNLPGNTSASFSYATVPTGRAGDLQTFTIYVKDLYANLCKCGGATNPIQIAAILTHTDGTQVRCTITSSDPTGTGTGEFTATVNATKSGLYTPNITADNIQIFMIDPVVNVTDGM